MPEEGEVGLGWKRVALSILAASSAAYGLLVLGAALTALLALPMALFFLAVVIFDDGARTTFLPPIIGFLALWGVLILGWLLYTMRRFAWSTLCAAVSLTAPVAVVFMIARAST